ncbi:MAG TPA: hypothetical protein GX707_00565 [Epulopiscium sp.]|nr:hypothetical protein [Candidatus Epulonipiscium sp.]
MFKNGIKKMLLGATAIMGCVACSMSGITIVKAQDSNVNVNMNFEDGKLGGWRNRGAGSGEITSNPLKPSEKSLHVTGRKENWQGVEYDISEIVKPGVEYKYSLDVYHKSTAPQAIKLTNQTKKLDGEQDWKQIAEQDKVPANKWVTLQGTNIVDIGCTSEVFYPEGVDPTLEFYIDNFKIEQIGSALPIQENSGEGVDWNVPNLNEAYKDFFTVGVALPADSLDDGDRSKWSLKHFNTFTAENNMKPESFLDQAASQAAGVLTLNFKNADQYYNYAKDNKISLRGHTLVWHSQTPDWFFKEGFKNDGVIVDRKTMLERMDNYIKQVVTRYITMDLDAKLTKPTIYAWDVVNEAVDGNARDGMRDSLWVQTIGPDFVEKAFESTRKHTKGKYKDGKVELLYNDYDTTNSSRREALLKIVKPIKDKGFIDGVGMQCHINIISPSIDNIEKTIRMIGDLGLDVHITELDISAYSNDGDRYDEFPEELAIKQAYRYKSLFDMFKANKEIVKNVTVWGLTDEASWLNTFPVTRNNWPLLFDKNLQPKLAYWALIDASKVPSLTQKIDANEGTIKVDGEEDLTWKIQAPTQISKTADIASFKTAWKKDMLYVWVEVMDQVVDKVDGIILYGDEMVTISRNGKVDKKDILAKVKETGKGYIVEVAIPLKEGIEIGKSVGFDLAVINGETITRWNDMSQTVDNNPKNYGQLLLQPAMKVTEAVKGTPTIGKNIDSIWDTANEITTDIYTQNTTGAKAKIKTLWDEDYLYVLAKVADPKLSDTNVNPWEQDSIEVFIDENLNRTDYYQSDDVQYRINFKNLVTINGGPENLEFKSVAKVIDGGYYIEMCIPHTIEPFKVGKIMGFDVQVNDDHGSGQRGSMANWYDETGSGYQNTKNFGTIILVNKDK